MNDSCDEIDSESKAFPTVTVAFAQKPEDLQPPNRVLYFDSPLTQHTVFNFLSFAQGLVFTAF
mgnify:FL=1